MNDLRNTESYNKVVEVLEKELDTLNIFNDIEVEKLKNIDILPCIDKQIILYIINSINNGVRKYDEYIEFIKDRRTTHFYSKYENKYDSIVNLINMYKIEYKNIYVTFEGSCVI